MSTAHSRLALRLVDHALACPDPEILDATFTLGLCELLGADASAAVDIDFAGGAGRRRAHLPRWTPVDGASFHDFAVRHPLIDFYRRAALTDVVRAVDAVSVRDWLASFAYVFLNDHLAVTRMMAIPLVATPYRLFAVVVVRVGHDFGESEQRTAAQLQPILAGIHALRSGLDTEHMSGRSADLTPREGAVLGLLADGLVVTAIARRLGIAPATVTKHIEHIYSKLGAHHRLEAVLIAQRRGLLQTRHAAPNR